MHSQTCTHVDTPRFGRATADSRVLADAANMLSVARTARRAVDPPEQKYTGLTLDDAYRVQRMQVDRRIRDGERLVGYKVAVFSTAAQRLSGSENPIYGHLLSGMFRLEDQPIAVGDFLQPKVEPQIAVVLKRPLVGPGVTPHEAIAAIDYVLAALEVSDSRIRRWQIDVIDAVADNASCGAVVLGSPPARFTNLHLHPIECTVRDDGTQGVSGVALGSPVASLVWLANELGIGGIALQPKQLVVTGAVTAATPVRAGDRITAHLSGLGRVRARFTERTA